MATPSAAQQIILLVLFVLPGITYQFVRQRARGPVPSEQVLAERVLRAITVSLALDAIYMMVAGPWIIGLVRPDRQQWFAGAAEHPRQAATVVFVLTIAVPVVAATAVGWLERRRAVATYRAEPTSWDFAFRLRDTPCFVRARLKDGGWVGGWFGQNSHASAFPQSPDIFLESAYEMGRDGVFGARIEHTAGLYVTMNDVSVIEFLAVPDVRVVETSGSNEGGAADDGELETGDGARPAEKPART
ncbi:DUF6338 family protein [Actinophytocola oryzae]|uniref:Uncharacterized protein n=1 Tax=Actinophytocola oryzae TaxID=502181 RepID=A0A4R7W6M1_9PSEU|nr:DUF6338 family protein [Actinophytocola oryzae]TDV57945.1 hypothetical protein CLV71_101819 [Actinophytocola oryzae]